MAEVVVTGAAGMIGSALARRCRDRGDQVVGIDLRPVDLPGVEPLVMDLGTAGASSPSGVAMLAGADLVIHAAAIVAEAGDRQRFVAVNVDGTRRLVAAAAAAEVGRIVHLSSIVVYGDAYPVGAMLDEDAPVVPTGGPYTDTKIGAEHAALHVAAATGAPLTIVRPGDVYGARSVPWVLRPVDLLRRGHFVLVDGGRWPLAPVHVDDVVTGILLAADSPDAVGRTYNLAGGRSPARRSSAITPGTSEPRCARYPGPPLAPRQRPRCSEHKRWAGRPPSARRPSSRSPTPAATPPCALGPNSAGRRRSSSPRGSPAASRTWRHDHTGSVVRRRFGGAPRGRW